MPSTPTFRAIATVAALAVASAGLLPLAHLHADDDHQVMHRHVIADESAHHEDDAGDHHASIDHANHADAKVLTLSYQLARQFAGIGCPASSCSIVAAPACTTAAPVSRRTLLPTHDPPFRFISSPAPPSAA